MDENKEPWFVLKDVCEILELRVAPTKTRLDQLDVTTTDLQNTRGQKVQMAIVNESGLYDAILDSRKPEANPLLVHDTAGLEVPSLGYNEGR